MTLLEQLLDAALNASRNEREIQPFLKKHILLVRNTLNVWAWNYVDVLAEFPLGADFKADFLIISADSGRWHTVFLELKSHRARLFTKRGVPSRELSLALRQLDDWERWVDRNEALVRDQLSKYFARRRVPAYCSRADRHVSAASEIRDPRTLVDFQFKVLMGRRSQLTDDEQERRGSYRMKGRDIVTYDRLLDFARKHDEAERDRRTTR